MGLRIQAHRARIVVKASVGCFGALKRPIGWNGRHTAVKRLSSCGFFHRASRVCGMGSPLGSSAIIETKFGELRRQPHPRRANHPSDHRHRPNRGDIQCYRVSYEGGRKGTPPLERRDSGRATFVRSPPTEAGSNLPPMSAVVQCRQATAHGGGRSRSAITDMPVRRMPPPLLRLLVL